MDDAKTQTVSFYNQHPISTQIVLEKLRASRGDLNDVSPEELWEHDQDHFGGTPATDELAREAQIGQGTQVVDFCAGLGGTVRYLAYRYGAIVTGIELTPVRVAGAQELTALVGLQNTAQVLSGDIADVPLSDSYADVVLSQEAFCHVPNLRSAMSEAFRILKKGGRFAFTDWVENTPLDPLDTELMWTGIAIQPLQSIKSYRALVCEAGFEVRTVQDLTAQWAPILRDRLKMYQALRDHAKRVGTPMGSDTFYQAYVRVVKLIEGGSLGGIRLIALK